MTERIQILEMVQKGIITPSEAEELLEIIEGFDKEKEYDKDTLVKIKERLSQICDKIEEWNKKTSESIKNSEAYQSLKKDMETLEENITKILKNVENKLNAIYNTSIKENFEDLGNSFKKLGKKIASIFKANDDKDSEEETNKDYIDLIEEEIKDSENEQ